MIRKFIKHECGAHLLEVAIVAPIFLMLLLSTIEFALIMYASSLLDSITHQASRMGRTGHTYDNTQPNREAAILTYIEETGRGLLDKENITITTGVFADMSDANIAGLSGAPSNNFGAGRQAVLYQVRYNWPIATPFLLPLGNNGDFVLTSTMVVQNENF